MKSSNPVFKDYQNPKTYSGSGYSEWQNPKTSDVATIDGVIAKTSISLGIAGLIAIITFMTVPLTIISPVAIGAIIASIILAVVYARKPNIGFKHVAVYALVEGVFIGAISKTFEYLYPGIVGAAIFATVIVAGLTLAFYKFSKFRVTEKFKKVVIISTASLAILYLGNLLLSIFGIHTGLIETGSNAGLLSIGISIVAVILATLNLLLDFDVVEKMIDNREPAEREWRAAFGLMVTLVWLYVELLRILSYFRK